jgi:hypothetical protein
MTYTTAKAQIITMAEAVTLTPNEWGDAFEHYPSATVDDPPPSRGFTLAAFARAHNSTSNPGPPRRTFVDMRLAIYYRRADGNPSALDDVLADDYDALRSYFLTTSNWNRPTSTIITLFRDGPEMLPAVVGETEDHIVQTIEINLEHITQTA